MSDQTDMGMATLIMEWCLGSDSNVLLWIEHKLNVALQTIYTLILFLRPVLEPRRVIVQALACKFCQRSAQFVDPCLPHLCSNLLG